MEDWMIVRTLSAGAFIHPLIHSSTHPLWDFMATRLTPTDLHRIIAVNLWTSNGCDLG